MNLLRSIPSTSERALVSERSPASPFFIVPARDERLVNQKIVELMGLGAQYVIVCGSDSTAPGVVHAKVVGKWDAINEGSRNIPQGSNVVVLNDVDTSIHRFDHAIGHINEKVALVYCRVKVLGGPQPKFYRILDPIRRIFHIAASGELMLVRRDAFERVLPIPPCLAEDSYILFKVLELGYKVHFCRTAYSVTERTNDFIGEEQYKFRTTNGIFQSLSFTRPPALIRMFYYSLPFLLPILLLAGEEGRAWARGIMKGFVMSILDRPQLTRW